MYKVSIAVVALTVLLVCSLAYGQGYGYYGQMYDDDAYEAWRAHAGWYDLGDAGSDIGFGADYTTKSYQASFDMVSTDAMGVDVDLTALSATYLWRMEEKPGTYYGAGLGWYDIGWGTMSDSTLGYHVVGGTEFGNADRFGEPAWFAEARYVFGTDAPGGSGDIDGIWVVGGRRF